MSKTLIALNALQMATFIALRDSANDKGIIHHSIVVGDGTLVSPGYKMNVVRALVNKGVLLTVGKNYRAAARVEVEQRAESVMRTATIAKREALAAQPRNPVGRPKGCTKAVIEARAAEQPSA